MTSLSLKTPSRAIIIDSLRRGLGVEDIGKAHGCHPDQIRWIVAELRREGVIQNIRFEKPGRRG